MNGNDDLYTEEIFNVMGQLKEKFNSHISGNINQNQLEENSETDNFRGRFSQFAPSGGILNPGENLVTEDGVATVSQDIRFQVAIFPINVDDAEPLRLEVDNAHREGLNKIIHINPAGGDMINVSSDDVEDIIPENCIDLVRISGSSYFREAIGQSLEHWEL